MCWSWGKSLNNFANWALSRSRYLLLYNSLTVALNHPLVHLIAAAFFLIFLKLTKCFPCGKYIKCLTKVQINETYQICFLVLGNQWYSEWLCDQSLRNSSQIIDFPFCLFLWDSLSPRSSCKHGHGHSACAARCQLFQSTREGKSALSVTWELSATWVLLSPWLW